LDVPSAATPGHGRLVTVARQFGRHRCCLLNRRCRRIDVDPCRETGRVFGLDDARQPDQRRLRDREAGAVGVLQLRSRRV